LPRETTLALRHLTTDEKKRKALIECYDELLAGHFGLDKTLYKLKTKYKWLGMRKDTEDWIRSCLTCKKAKAPRHTPHSLLNSLLVPDGPWEDVTIDFITDLPPSTLLGVVYN
jgi:hypothetical protein